MTRAFEALLARAVDAAIAAGGIPATACPPCVIEEPEDPRFGDATCRVAMGLARRTGRPAIDLARVIVAHVEDPSGVLDGVEAAGPGFINLRASLAFWRGTLATPLPGRREGPARGRAVVLCPQDAGCRVALQAGLVSRLLGLAGADVACVTGDAEELARVADAARVVRAIVVHEADRAGAVRRAKDAFAAAGGAPGRVTVVPVAPLVVRRRGVLLGGDVAAGVARSPAGRFALAGVPAETPAELDAGCLGAERIDDPYFAVRYALARIARTGTLGAGLEAGGPLEERDRDCARGVGTHADVVQRAARRLAPEAVVGHGRSLAAAFHRHYNRAGFDATGASRGRATSALAAGVMAVLQDVLALVGEHGG